MLFPANATMSDAALTETTESGSPTHPETHLRKYRRLSIAQLKYALELSREGKDQYQIAEVLGVNQSTICRALAHLADDSSSLAIDYAKSSAFTVMRRIVKHSLTKDDAIGMKAAQVVLAASGVTERVSGVTVGVQVIIGQPGAPASEPTNIVVLPASQAHPVPE